MSPDRKINRRTFLTASATGGAALILGFYIHYRGSEGLGSGSRVFKPNAWIRITQDNQITVLVEIPEMGQGPRTADTMMLAEELEVDWSTIRVEQAPVILETYHNLVTGGSGGIETAWGYMRKVGAQAREMLLMAAANKWAVGRNECRAEAGTVIHKPSKRHLTYGELVESAAKLPEIKGENIPLKRPQDFRLIGKPVPRVDLPSKVDGSAVFGIDVRLPGMLFAVIARCPYFGGKPASFKADAAKAIPGVRAVLPIPPIGFVPKIERNFNVAGGVAVIGDSSWAAIEGRRALELTWDRGVGASESTESLRKRLQEGAVGPPTFVVVNRGDVRKAMEKATNRVEASYELPFQAHATMEPMNTTVHVRERDIEVWSPTQAAPLTHAEIVQLSGLPADKVKVNVTLSGGSFGRRYQWDFAAEAWQVAKEMKQPVQLLWTREDDMQHDFYRQYSYHHMTGALDEAGNLAAWSHRVVSTPIRTIFDSEQALRDPKHVAATEAGDAAMVPYETHSLRVDYAPVHSVVPRAWWRSVSTSFNAFAIEYFVDELAHAAKRDPYEFRMNLLHEDRKIPNAISPDDGPVETSRFRAVLTLAAEKAGWRRPLPPGHGRGIACYVFAGSYIAHVAEVTVDKKGTVRVLRVISAVDCGVAVNPDGVRAMTEGAINFALTPVLNGEITIKDGAVEQDNFDGYQVLRITDAPDIEVYIVPNSADPAGMGESAVPPLAPAVANAVFAATGQRVRRLPVNFASRA
jgi:isoquinoline 1-oxidoreductase beta subunit